MLIEDAKGGHTNVVTMLIDYPNSLVMAATNDMTAAAAAAAAQVTTLTQPYLGMPSPPLLFFLQV